MYVLLKTLVIRPVDKSSDIHLDESRHLAWGGGLKRASPAIVLFCLTIDSTISTQHYLCRRVETLAGSRKLQLQGLVPARGRCERIRPQVRKAGASLGTRLRLEPGVETETGQKRERKWREGEGGKRAQEFSTKHNKNIVDNVGGT